MSRPNRLLLLLGLASLVGCGTLITPRKEVEIGRGVDGELRKQYDLVRSSDPVAKWAVEFIAPLQRSSARFRDPGEIGGYKVKVIADPKLVNAFAAPGGYTYISTGLILQAKSCAEIAGVMGHELAHVTQKHGVKAIEGAMAAQQLSDLLLGEGSISSQAAVTIVNILQGTKFSRDDETEADGVGLQISADGGYNPLGLALFFEKLLGGKEPPTFLSSHPATQDRIASVKRAVRARYGDRYTEADARSQGCQGTAMQLPAVQQRIKGGRLELVPKGR